MKLATDGRLKVLLSAYACEPRRGSEPSVGWNLALGMARHHDVWVITRERSRIAIERELSQLEPPLPHFAYVDLPAWARVWKRGRIGVALYYEMWQMLGWRAARELHARVGFDLAQHVTFVKYTTPSFLARLPVPFIWGPVGGGETMPAAFERELHWRGRATEAARRLARWSGEHDPRVRATARRSALALATTEETADRLRGLGARKVRLLSQVGAPREQLAGPDVVRPESMRPLRLISIGRLLHWKGFDLGVRAFAAAGLSDAEYWILGAGPEKRALQSLAQRLGVRDRVHLPGNVPHAQVLDRLRRSHLLIHPSLHESGGGVCCEALAAGCPVACLDLGGPALQVNAGNGFRIAPSRPDRAVAELAEVMLKLADDAELFARKSRGARQAAVDELSWERRCERLASLYRSVLESGRGLNAN